MLSANLPRGYRYELSPDGNYMVVPGGDGQQCGISGTIDRAANGIPSHIAEDELLEYAYRTQKSLKLLRDLEDSLLEGRDRVIQNPFSYFHVDFEDEVRFPEIEEKVGESELSLSFVGMSHVNLLGAEFDIYKAMVLVDMTLERLAYDGDGRGVEVYVTDAPDVSFKVVERLCLSEQAALDSMELMYKRHTDYKVSE